MVHLMQDEVDERDKDVFVQPEEAEEVIEVTSERSLEGVSSEESSKPRATLGGEAGDEDEDQAADEDEDEDEDEDDSDEEESDDDEVVDEVRGARDRGLVCPGEGTPGP